METLLIIIALLLFGGVGVEIFKRGVDNAIELVEYIFNKVNEKLGDKNGNNN